MTRRQYQYQSFLLQCPYRDIELNKLYRILPEETLLFNYGRELFDNLVYKRKIPLTYLDANVDSKKDLEKISSLLQGIQALYIVDDRMHSDSIFVKKHSEATKQAFIWQLENMGIPCFWCKRDIQSEQQAD